MKMILLIAILFPLLSCNSSTDVFAGERESIKYKGWLTDTVEEFILPAQGETISFVRHARDASSSSSFCDESSDYFCIRSFTFTFVVPKCLPDNEVGWDFEGSLYKVVNSNLEATLFGRTFRNLFLIEAPKEASVIGRQTSKSTLVLFSKKFGVIGYAQDAIHGPTPTYWLVSDYGLGSNLGQTALCESSTDTKNEASRKGSKKMIISKHP